MPPRTRTPGAGPAQDAAPRASTPAGDKPLQIGQVIELTGLSVNTLRHWDEVGLLSPSARSEGGFRLYSRHDVDRLLVIRRMKPLGFSLEQMGDLMGIADAVDAEGFEGDPAAAADLAGRLQDYLDLAEESRRRLLAKVAMAEEFVGLLRERHARAARAAGSEPASSS